MSFSYEDPTKWQLKKYFWLLIFLKWKTRHFFEPNDAKIMANAPSSTRERRVRRNLRQDFQQPFSNFALWHRCNRHNRKLSLKTFDFITYLII
jgi:hypothetical protein